MKLKQPAGLEVGEIDQICSMRSCICPQNFWHFPRRFAVLRCNSLCFIRNDPDRAPLLTHSELQLLQKPTRPYQTNYFHSHNPHSLARKLLREAFLFRPVRTVSSSVCLELHQIRVHKLLPAECALHKALDIRNMKRLYQVTSDVGFGALTGLPLGLTGALVPAASAFFCSR
jgi:hypothetical protein